MPVSSDNWLLDRLSKAARLAAAEQDAVFVDLFDYMKEVYVAANRAGGTPLTHDKRLPTEAGHTVIASVILKGIGVTSQQLNRIGWSPLSPRQMQRIRQVLALSPQPPDLDMALQSRQLYASIQRFDEAFFKLWRLSPRSPARYPKQAQLAAMERAWTGVKTLVGPRDR